MLFVLVSILLGAEVVRAALPPYITTCSRDDPRLDECYFQRAREAIPHIIKGDPKYGIPALDPLLIEKVHLDVGYGLFVDMSNVVIRGFNNITVDDITNDLKTYNGYIELGIPRMTVSTDYDVDGNIFTLPIKGNGQGNLTMTDLKLFFKCPYELMKRDDGKDYVHLYNTSVDFDMSRLYIKLDNLFSGNKFLDESMNLVLNENWMELIKGAKPLLLSATLLLMGFALHFADESMNLVLNENWKELIKGAKPLLLDGLHSLLTHTIDTLLTEVDWDEVLPKEGIWI